VKDNEFESHIEALADLRDFLKQRDGKVPKDVLNALSRDVGFSAGRKYSAVGIDQVQRLVNKYAPGRYEFKTVVRLVNENGQLDEQ